MFGEGIYLSTELDMSLTYSRGCRTWDKSNMGENLTCVLMAEVLDHKDVKMHTEGNTQNNKV